MLLIRDLFFFFLLLCITNSFGIYSARSLDFDFSIAQIFYQFYIKEKYNLL